MNSAAGGLVRKGELLRGQVNISQAEFEAIELAQLRELWSEYGTLAETWSAHLPAAASVRVPSPLVRLARALRASQV